MNKPLYKLKITKQETTFDRKNVEEVVLYVKKMGKAFNQIKKENLVSEAVFNDLKEFASSTRKSLKELFNTNYSVELSRTINGKELKKTTNTHYFESTPPQNKMKNEVVSLYKGLKEEIKATRTKSKTLNLRNREHFGMRFKVQDGVHIQNGDILKLLNRSLIKHIEENKSPNSTDHHVGIEIEFLSPFAKDEMKMMLADKNIIKHIQLKSDGSLRAERGHHGHELAIVAKQSEIYNIMNKVCGILNTKAEAYVNDSCGLHVHIDMRNRDPNHCFRNLFFAQSIMFDMIPQSRRDNNQYCRRNTASEFGADSNRYKAINDTAYNKYKTIEIRLHSGTTNEVKINNWVKLLCTLCDSEENIGKSYTDVDKLAKRVDLDENLVEYIKQRVDKFKDVSIDAKADHMAKDNYKFVG